MPILAPLRQANVWLEVFVDMLSVMGCEIVSDSSSEGVEYIPEYMNVGILTSTRFQSCLVHQ